MLESKYQAQLIKKIEMMLPGCLITMNDANHRQGLPDLTVFFRDKWAFLEVKASEKSRERPNQRHYIEQWANRSFAAFIFPENEEQIMDALRDYMLEVIHC